jgi:hypothetical protein
VDNFKEAVTDSALEGVMNSIQKKLGLDEPADGGNSVPSIKVAVQDAITSMAADRILDWARNQVPKDFNNQVQAVWNSARLTGVIVGGNIRAGLEEGKRQADRLGTLVENAVRDLSSPSPQPVPTLP